MSDKFQIHLSGPGFSGRAVRYRTLEIEEIDRVEILVASSPEVRSGISLIGWNQLVAKESVPLMLVAMTEPVAEKDLPTARWTPCSPEMFQAESGDGLKKFFTTKDIRFLRDLYTREHEIGKSEVDKMLAGKAPIVD